MMTSSIIFFTPNRDQFFLIPADRELPAGDFVIRTVEKRELRVSEDALQEFEIPKEQAHALLEKEMRRSLRQARLAFFRQAEASETDAADGASESTLRGEDLLRDVLQWPGGEELKDEHINNGLRALLNLLGNTLDVALSEDPKTEAQATENLSALRTTLEGYGIKVDKPIEEMPKKLAEWRNDPKHAADQEKAAELAAEIKKLVEALPKQNSDDVSE